MEKLYSKIRRNEEKIKKLELENKGLKQQIMERMKSDEIDSYLGKKFSISYIPEGLTFVFNQKQFKAEQEEIYKRYMTQERKTSEQIRISDRKS